MINRHFGLSRSSHCLYCDCYQYSAIMLSCCCTYTAILCALSIVEGRLLDIACLVCGDKSSGRHYGIYSCDGMCQNTAFVSLGSSMDWICDGAVRYDATCRCFHTARRTAPYGTVPYCAVPPRAGFDMREAPVEYTTTGWFLVVRVG